LVRLATLALDAGVIERAFQPAVFLGGVGDHRFNVRPPRDVGLDEHRIGTGPRACARFPARLLQPHRPKAVDPFRAKIFEVAPQCPTRRR
jgi:hypothetical protein